MEDAAQKEHQLHRGVAANLNQLGHQETPQTVNPDDNFTLKKIGESLGEGVHIVGSPLDEMARGESSHIELEPAKSWRQRLMERIRKLPLRKKAA